MKTISYSLNAKNIVGAKRAGSLLSCYGHEMSKVAGWLAIVLAIFSLALSFVPGAFSIFGLLISLAALIVSVFSVRELGKKYFRTTMTIVVFAVFLVNDGLRMWSPLERPINFKITLYGMLCFVIIGCTFAVNKLANEEKQP